MEKTYYISGHSDLTSEEFVTFYADLIKQAIDSDSYFVVGDLTPCDEMAQYLLAAVLKPEQHFRVKVFCEGDNPKILLSPNFMIVGGFRNPIEASVAMTFCSDEDIIVLKPNRPDSLVAKTILRRYTPQFDFTEYAKAKVGNTDFWRIFLNTDDKQELIIE